MLPDVTGPESYGPPLTDYDVVVDPETEISATKLEAWAVDVAAITHVAPRAWARVIAGNPPVLAAHDAVWGGTDAVKPTIARVGAGVYTVTWASSYYDLNPTTNRRVLRTVNVRSAHACAHGQTASKISVDLISAISVGVYADSDVSFSVWIY